MDLDGASDLSSELSSVGSLSPPPPDFDCYPTPPGSQDTDGDSTPSNRSEVYLPITTDDHPPARKRRKFEPKPRSTQHLDLKSYSEFSETQRQSLDWLVKTLRNRRKIVVIAGAGISVSAGSK
jgi:NAD+-dependent protein deacetylase SIR2